MQVQSINNNTSFGMAVKTTSKGKKFMEKYLTPKGIKQISELVEAEKSNPTDIIIGTEKKWLGSARMPMQYWTQYDAFVVSVEDRKFDLGPMEVFSTSRAIVSAVKKGVKYARELTEKRNILNDIPTKN